MRKLFSFLLIFLALSAFADDVPGYSGYVNDYAGVISEKDKASMEEVAKEVEEKTGAQIAVLTVKSMAPYASIDDFSMESGRERQGHRNHPGSSNGGAADPHRGGLRP